MNLYFIDSDNKQHLVKKDVEVKPIGENQDLCKYVNIDLSVRKPGFQTHYTRCWYDNFFRLWIDFGSHTEFYICQEENMARNLVEEKLEDECEACHA